MWRHPRVWAAGEGSYAEAAVAYEAAGDLDNVVRLNLDQLKNPLKAAAIVRKAGSRDAAQRLAQYCLAARDYQVWHNMNIRSAASQAQTLAQYCLAARANQILHVMNVRSALQTADCTWYCFDAQNCQG